VIEDELKFMLSEDQRGAGYLFKIEGHKTLGIVWPETIGVTQTDFGAVSIRFTPGELRPVFPIIVEGIIEKLTIPIKLEFQSTFPGQLVGNVRGNAEAVAYDRLWLQNLLSRRGVEHFVDVGIIDGEPRFPILANFPREFGLSEEQLLLVDRLSGEVAAVLSREKKADGGAAVGNP